MAKDLEKFLQQAAQRLADSGKPQAQPARPRRQPPVRQKERTIEPEIVDAEIVDLDALGPDPLSDLDTRHLDPAVTHRPALARSIESADERMSQHVEHVVGHDIVHLRDASQAFVGRSGTDDVSDSTQVQRRNQTVSPLIKMLRNPDTLRAAFIASEIFGRKYD